MEADESSPLYMIVPGTAGTGKSYLIHCLRLLLKDKVCVAAPTGVAAFKIDGYTLHSLLYTHQGRVQGLTRRTPPPRTAIPSQHEVSHY